MARLLRDEGAVRLGGTALTAHLNAGHMKACTTWTMTTEEKGKPFDVVFVCSTSVLSGYQLVKNPAYPSIASDYEKTFRTLRSLPCDVFLASHGSFFDLAGKRAALMHGAKSNPFIDPAGYRSYVDRSEAVFRQQLRRQMAKSAGHSAT